MIKTEELEWITDNDENLSPEGFIADSGFGQVYKVANSRSSTDIR